MPCLDGCRFSMLSMVRELLLDLDKLLESTAPYRLDVIVEYVFKSLCVAAARLPTRDPGAVGVDDVMVLE